jgi:hypothetical protein
MMIEGPGGRAPDPHRGAAVMVRTKSRERSAPAIPLGPLVKDVLKVAYRARRPVLLEGATGIGKSQIVEQMACELGIGLVVLDLSLLEPPDLVGLPTIAAGRTTYAVPSILPRDGAGILLLEELNRAERYIQQPALQLLTGRRLHEYELPAGWSTCAAINPEDGDYQVTPLDPALRSRFLNLAVRADRACWLEWATANSVHAAVLQLARQHERFLDGTPPRSWAYVSDFLRALEPGELRQPGLLRAALGGYVAPAWVELLLEALEKCADLAGLDVQTLLCAYHRDPALARQLTALREAGRTDVLEQLAYQVLCLIDGPALHQAIGNKAFELEAFERLLPDLPGDYREELQRVLGDNLAAAALLNVKPADLLRGYPGSRIAEQVERWAKDAGKAHRVALLSKALCHHLEKHPDVIALRKDKGAMTGLGLFLTQIGAARQGRVLEVVDRLNMQPDYPRR